MSMRYTGPGKCLGAGALIALAPTVVHAGQLDYGVDYSVVATDNVARSADADSALVNIARGLLAYREKTETVDAAVYSILEGRLYLGAEADYDPQALFSLNGRAVWALSPRRLTFTIEDVYAQAPTDPTRAVSVANYQDTNVLSLGPNVFLYPSPATTLELNARYANAYYEDAATDNDRVAGAARLFRQMSPRTTVSLNYEPSRVDYDDDILNQDYTRQDAFVGLGTRVWDNALSIALGHTTIDRENDSELEGTLARVTLGRQMTRAASIDFTASREYSDATRATLVVDPSSDVALPIPTNPEAFVGGGIYYGKSLTALYQYRRDYGVSAVHGFWRELDYVSVSLDQRSRGAIFVLGYDYSAAWTASLLGDYAKIDYLNVPRSDTDTGLGARLLHRFRRDTSIQFEVRWSERDSTLASQNWEEWRALLGIAYFTSPAAFSASPFLFTDPIYR